MYPENISIAYFITFMIFKGNSFIQRMMIMTEETLLGKVFSKSQVKNI